MDYERLFILADAARAGQKPKGEDAQFVAETVPAALAGFPSYKRPERVPHPAGFTVSGAPVGTYLRSAMLITAAKLFGERYKGAPFYERVETDFAMRIMSAHFNKAAPKGCFCCIQCSLAVLPALEANTMRWFDCRPAAENLRAVIGRREWRFKGNANPKMLAWSLGV